MIRIPEHPKHKIGEKIACRNAYGEELIRLGELNEGKIIGVGCDLESSVKTNNFAKKFPKYYVQCGLQENNAVTFAGSLSEERVVFYSSFGVFCIDEVYNQLRMNDINLTNLNVVGTHLGLDVGEDGQTHQCIDYIGLVRNLLGFSILIPADAVETYQIIDYVASNEGNYFVGMGRSEVPVVLSSEYRFEFGKDCWIREGEDATIITFGNMLHRAVNVSDRLRKVGLKVGVVNKSTITKIDKKSLDKAIKTKDIYVYEDHIAGTGLGGIISNYVACRNLDVVVKQVGIVQYGGSGKPDDLYRQYSLDEDSVYSLIYWDKLKDNIR